MLPLNFKKIIRQIHLWLGLISGLVVFVLGITGSIYTFADEIKDWIYKDRLFVTPPKNVQPLPLSQLITIAEQSLGKEKKISRAELSQQPDRSYMFRAMKLDREAIGYWNSYIYYDKVYLNPYTGEVLYRENAKKEFFTVVLALHMNLLLGNQIGHFIVKWSVVGFLILLISGIILWWPKKWKRTQLKKNFSIKWQAKKKRLNYDLHNVLGFYSFFILLIIALTGLAWSFDLTTDKKSKVLSDTSNTNKSLPADYIIRQARTAAPLTAYFLYNFPAVKSGTVNVSAYQSESNLYQKIQFRFDRYTGKLLQQGKPFNEMAVPNQIIALNYDLHTGSALGLTGKMLVFFAGLIAASLPVTGFIIWRNKSRKKNSTLP